MIEWWQQRESREQWLIGIAAILAVLVGIWQTLVLPVNASNANARLRLQQAERDLHIVTQNLSSLSAGSALIAEPFSRAVLVRKAAIAGISLQRVQPGKAGELEFWSEGANTTALYSLLRELVNEHNAILQQVYMQRNPLGGVDARIQIAAG